jgi:flagellar protein FlbT
MPLHLELKPNEKLFIGGAVVVNHEDRCRITVLNDVPVLREKDIMTEAEADTPCKRIYFLIQSMYMDEPNLGRYQQIYWDMVRNVVNAAPSTAPLLIEASEQIAQRRYYQAIKAAQRLIDYEKELIEHVSRPT